MKNLKALMLFFLGLVLVSCSSDDDSGSTAPLNGDYFPSAMGDLWIYNVTNENPDDPNFYQVPGFVLPGTEDSLENMKFLFE